jgi:hypothetical protein
MALTFQSVLRGPPGVEAPNPLNEIERGERDVADERHALDVGDEVVEAPGALQMARSALRDARIVIRPQDLPVRREGREWIGCHW